MLGCQRRHECKTGPPRSPTVSNDVKMPGYRMLLDPDKRSNLLCALAGAFAQHNDKIHIS